MNAKPNPPPSGAERSLRGRAEALRAVTRRLPPPTRLDNLLADAQGYATGLDLSAFSIEDLARLYDVARHASIYWGHVGDMPLCNGLGAEGSSLTNVGWVVEAEEHRMSFLRDRCIAEISQRQPADDAERDESLCVRIQHEIDCGGRIDRLDASNLLIEALKAWG